MKRTNKLYGVTVAQYAWIYVEADSPQEAMKIAGNADLEELIPDSAFEESEIGVDSCNTYSEEIDGLYLEDEEKIITSDGNMTVEEYEKALEEQED